MRTIIVEPTTSRSRTKNVASWPHVIYPPLNKSTLKPIKREAMLCDVSFLNVQLCAYWNLKYLWWGSWYCSQRPALSWLRGIKNRLPFCTRFRMGLQIWARTRFVLILLSKLDDFNAPSHLLQYQSEGNHSSYPVGIGSLQWFLSNSVATRKWFSNQTPYFSIHMFTK